MNMGELELAVSKQIQQAMDQRQFGRLAHLGALAEEMETKKNEWITRLGDPSEPRPHNEKPIATPPYGNYTGRQIRAFEFAGTRVVANTYKELLLRLANILRRKHGEAFDRAALSLGGRKRQYFAIDPRDLKYAQELDGGQLFAETNLNANLIVKICRDMLASLGHDPSSLSLH